MKRLSSAITTWLLRGRTFGLHRILDCKPFPPTTVNWTGYGCFPEEETLNFLTLHQSSECLWFLYILSDICVSLFFALSSKFASFLQGQKNSQSCLHKNHQNLIWMSLCKAIVHNRRKHNPGKKQDWDVEPSALVCRPATGFSSLLPNISRN